MHSKKKLPYDPGTLPPDKRFRANLSDLFLSGDLAAQRAHSLFAAANAAGTHHVTDLAGNKRPDGNSARDLLRRLRKSSHWPPLYWADIPVWLDKKQKEEIVQIPFLLPHEVVHAMFQWTDIGNFSDLAHLPTDERALLETGKILLGRDVPLLPLGLWMDGVPCNWDRSHSLNVLTISFPSACGPHRSVRIPLFGIKQHFCSKHKTFDAVFEVICWSLRMLFLGAMPSCRHDGQPFATSDAGRKNWAEKPLQRCMLTQVRGRPAFAVFFL